MAKEQHRPRVLPSRKRTAQRTVHYLWGKSRRVANKEKQMIDQQVEWLNNPNEASMWAMGWIEDVKTRSSHTGVRRIHEAAAKLRERFCCNGMWAP